jgi:uncharacterized protein
MRIDVHKLKEKESTFAYSYEPDGFNLEDEEIRLLSPLELSGKMIKGETQVELSGIIKTTTEVSCDRCLCKVVVNVENEFDVLYVPDSMYDSAHNLELNEDDLTLTVFDGEVIDVDELAREQFYLAMPSRVLCREDCKGLCPKCGANKNIKACSCEEKETDPRWAALKDFK